MQACLNPDCPPLSLLAMALLCTEMFKLSRAFLSLKVTLYSTAVATQPAFTRRIRLLLSPALGLLEVRVVLNTLWLSLASQLAPGRGRMFYLAAVLGSASPALQAQSCWRRGAAAATAECHTGPGHLALQM